jgi:hypothetical protein
VTSPGPGPIISDTPEPGSAQWVASPTLATTSVKASVRAVLLTDMGASDGWAVRGTRVLLQPYLVLGGWPTDVLDTTVVVSSGVNVSGHTGSAQPTPPDELGHDLAGRWVGGTQDFDVGVWATQEGDPALTWQQTDTDAAPYGWDTYPIQMGAGSTTVPALIFDGTDWMQLTTGDPWTTAELTVAMVVSLNSGAGSSYALVASPVRDSDDPTPVTQVTLAFEHGWMVGYAGGVDARVRDTPYDGTLAGVVLRVGNGSVAVSVLTGATLRSAVTAAAAMPPLIDFNLYLGRAGTMTDNSSLADIALFDVAVWPRCLTDEEARDVLDRYDSSYGLSR